MLDPRPGEVHLAPVAVRRHQAPVLALGPRRRALRPRIAVDRRGRRARRAAQPPRTATPPLPEESTSRGESKRRSSTRRDPAPSQRKTTVAPRGSPHTNPNAEGISGARQRQRVASRGLQRERVCLRLDDRAVGEAYTDEETVASDQRGPVGQGPPVLDRRAQRPGAERVAPQVRPARSAQRRCGRTRGGATQASPIALRASTAHHCKRPAAIEPADGEGPVEGHDLRGSTGSATGRQEEPASIVRSAPRRSATRDRSPGVERGDRRDARRRRERSEVERRSGARVDRDERSLRGAQVNAIEADE